MDVDDGVCDVDDDVCDVVVKEEKSSLPEE